MLRCGREYRAIDNTGYELAKIQTVEPILYGQLRKIDKRIKRASRTQKILYDTFKDKVPREVKGRLIVTGVFIATISYFDEESRKRISENKDLKPLRLMEPKPILPDELLR